jgi:predicted site-specific integrase-resolvase
MLTIGQMAARFGVTVATMRRWDRDGKLKPQSRTIGGHRRYATDPSEPRGGKTVCYARVSTAEQKADLERQKSRLTEYAADSGWGSTEVVTDIGSGLNCRKKGLLHVMELLLRGEVRRLVIENKDRLLRFGADLLFKVCQFMGAEVVITQGDDAADEASLVKDVLAIITVFSARLYGSRSHSRRKTAAGAIAA